MPRRLLATILVIAASAVVAVRGAYAQQQAAPPAGRPAAPAISVTGVKAYSAKGKETDFLVAERAVVTGRFGVPGKFVPVSVTLGGQPVQIIEQTAAALTIQIPRDFETLPQDVVLVVSTQGAPPVAAVRQPVLRVYPSPSATVTKVEPSVIDDDSIITVRGEGFFAPPDQLALRLRTPYGTPEFRALRVAHDGTWFTTQISAQTASRNRPEVRGGEQDAEVAVWGVPAAHEGSLRVTVKKKVDGAVTRRIALLALTPLIAVTLIIWILFRTSRKRQMWCEALLLEPENRTYSLSRAQFVWWLFIFSYCYIFLFFGRGFHEDTWMLPSLSGFAYTFMISLGTLLVAQGTSSAKGAKGSGLVNPSPSDLILHGGVLALERVQQVIWTVLTGVAFVWITVRTYATASALPTIPSELLVLMGISSAGYLGGKLARKPGPIIEQIMVRRGSVVLEIYGTHLSTGAAVIVDGAEQPRTAVRVLQSDPDHPGEFAKALSVTLPETVLFEDWQASPHVVIVCNADAQRAEWQSQPPTVTSINVDRSNPEIVVVTVLGERIVPGAVLTRTGFPVQHVLTRDPADPNRWLARVPEFEWPDAETEAVVTNPTGERAVFHWTPPRRQ